MRRLRALRDDAPVALEHPFWGAQFLAMAFGHELGFASAHPPALRSIFNLAAAAAERGLVPYQAVRSAHGQLRSLGLLTCDRVDPTPVDDDDPSRGVVTPWELFASPTLRRAAAEAPSRSRPKASPSFAARSGPRLASAVANALRRHVDEARGIVSPRRTRRHRSKRPGGSRRASSRGSPATKAWTKTNARIRAGSSRSGGAAHAFVSFRSSGVVDAFGRAGAVRPAYATRHVIRVRPGGRVRRTATTAAPRSGSESRLCIIPTARTGGNRTAGG